MISSSTRRFSGTVIGAVAGLALIGIGAPAAQAAPQASAVNSSAECGFLGWGRYNHCGSGTVALDVDQWDPTFPSSLYCVGPGITDLDGFTNKDLQVYWASYAPGWEGCRPGTVWVP